MPPPPPRVLFEGRFFLGLGTGEALNEHILGQRWPAVETRLQMLDEAIDLMRELWTGEVVDHHGTHYEVENARLYDAPEEPIPVVVSAFGAKAGELAGRTGDGIWMTSPAARRSGPTRTPAATDPRIGQLTICWAERGRGHRHRPPGVAELRHPRPARPGPAHADPLRPGRSLVRSRRRGHGDHLRAGSRARAGEPSAPTRRPVSTSPPPPGRAGPGGLPPVLGGAARSEAVTRVRRRSDARAKEAEEPSFLGREVP